MKQKYWIPIAVLVIVSMVAGQCGGAATPAPAPKEEAPAAEEQAPVEAEPVTIRVWTHQNDSFNKGLEEIADAYKSDHANVSFEFETFDYDTYIQTLQTALPAGTEADILQMFGTWTCSYADNLMEVPENVVSMSEAKDKFFEAPLLGYTCDGKLYGLPQEFNIEYGATLFNTQMAAEAGVADDGWADWNEFMADAQAMTQTQDDVITRAGYHFTAGDATGFTFYSLIKQAGGDYLKGDGTAFTIDTPEGKQALELMKSMVDAGIIDPVLFNDEQNWVADCYFEELCAQGLVGPWAVAEYSDDFPEVREATKYVELPSLGNEPTFVADSGWGLTVSKRSEVPAEAWDFIKFVAMNEENALNWNIGSGTLPALKANTEGAARDKLLSDFPYFDAFLNILPYGTYIGHLPDRDLLWYDITYPHILNVLQGNEEIDEALSAMEREANESFQ
jgi:multiple sugar transport system substrate-binding protein